MGATTMIGARVRRLEDPRLLRGKGSYVDDISLPGTLHAVLVRSPYGHARIKRIDLAAVKATSGVIDAFTLTDGWKEPPTIPVLVGVPSLLPCSQYPLAACRIDGAYNHDTVVSVRGATGYSDDDVYAV